ncbi:MAG TPA: carboxypeptidase regulatory-like domain-containing protein [Clostridia bacterium]|nr:carboxypeptidase regulatory-like domain-containing protein [Clostridia bacterium]
MKKLVWLLVALLLVASAVAQETTAGIQGTVKDPTGAVVSKATVEVAGPALIGTKKVETDNSGYFRFANLPPGEYTITTTAAGFRTSKLAGIKLEVGKLPTIDLKLEVGGNEQVVEVSGEAPIVDVAQSKVQTNVTSDIIAGIPKGRSFQSVIQFAPGARNEPLQADRATGIAGYQIDGASGSENSFLMEGQETSDVQTGQTRTNAPFEFIQEVQVKTSGFEAEYGGALGGVVNVIQKRGSNAWHGSIFSYYAGDIFNSAPNRYTRYTDSDNEVDPISKPGCVASNTCRLGGPFEYVQPKKDHRRTIEPGFEVGGYLVKDRIWAFASAVPRIDRITRTVKMDAGERKFFNNEETYYSLARLDALVTSKIRVFGSWQYSYDRNSGISMPNADDAFGKSNDLASANPDDYNSGIGNVQPNIIFNTGADITLTNNLIATTRFGRFYSDYQDRGLPTGVRYRWRDSNYISGIAYGALSSIGIEALDGTPIPDDFAMTRGFNSMGVNLQTLYDKFQRKSFTQDLAWFKKGFFGTHNVKGGYAQNRLSNSTINGYITSQAYLAYGRPYTVLPSNKSVCQAITAGNVAQGWNPGGDAAGNSCQGLWGTVNFREYGLVGSASSANHALYLQDAWTIGKGITLNIGVRADKEAVPSYNSAPGIAFGFSDKIAPRLGGSWDVLQNGKFKVYGSFGYFFDIMKYEMPRGSFGGDYWHDCVYAMDDPDYTKYVPTRGANGHFCNPTGGANFVGGDPAGLRFIENKDFRTSSNDPTNVRIDPNLEPMKQHEMVFGADYAITPVIGLETRYSRKRLDQTIEDAGLLTAAGEQFYIINPGTGINRQPVDSINCVNCPVQPKAVRNYDALEIRLTKRASDKWFGSLSYTYSKLSGNYSGLSSTDTADSSTGRSSPNVERAFDEPWMQFDSYGRVIDGPLATDRPNTFKAYGWYHLKWWGNHESLIGLTQQWYQGTPLTTYFDAYGANQYPEGRGMFVPATRTSGTGVVTFGKPVKLRTPMFSQLDLNFVQDFHISKTNENLKLGFEANVTNVFNQHSVLSTDTNLFSTGSLQPTAGLTAHCQISPLPTDCAGVDYKSLMTGFNWQAQANSLEPTTVLNSQYGAANLFQVGRTMRFKVRFSF